MALFELAIGTTLLAEGGYSNNPSDAGGETYEGISRKNFPEWSGWKLIDAQPNKRDLNSNPILQGLVVGFYRGNFWQFDGLNDQQLAGKIFDLSVNVGKVHGIKILQQTLGINADGIYGPATEQAGNSHQNGSLVPLIRTAAENYHEQIVLTHPEDAQFLKGWLRRDAS